MNFNAKILCEGLRIAPNDKNLLEKSELTQKAIRDSATSTTSPQGSGKLDNIQKWLRAALFIFLIGYIIPFIGRSTNMLSYKCFIISSASSYIISLYRAHGMVQFNVSYLQRVMLDTTSMYLK